MLRIWALFLSFLCFGYARAQAEGVLFLPEDQVIFNRLVDTGVGEDSGQIGEVIVATGQQLLNTPYVAGTLEAHSPEILIVNLRGLDCTTFVENVLVVSGMRARRAKGVGHISQASRAVEVSGWDTERISFPPALFHRLDPEQCRKRVG